MFPKIFPNSATCWKSIQTYSDQKYLSTTVQMPALRWARVPKKISTMPRANSATVSWSEASGLRTARRTADGSAGRGAVAGAVGSVTEAMTVSGTSSELVSAAAGERAAHRPGRVLRAGQFDAETLHPVLAGDLAGGLRLVGVGPDLPRPPGQVLVRPTG